METTPNLLDFPNHVLIHILNFLDPSDIPQLALTNKKIHNLVETNIKRMPKLEVNGFIFDCFKECIQIFYTQSDGTENHVKHRVHPFDLPELLRTARRLKLEEFGCVKIIEASLSNQCLATVLKFLEVIIKCGWPSYRQQIPFSFEMSGCEFVKVDLEKIIEFIAKIIAFGCQNLEIVHVNLNEFEKMCKAIKQSKITELSDFE